jgi:hypothetical protein
MNMQCRVEQCGVTWEGLMAKKRKRKTAGRNKTAGKSKKAAPRDKRRTKPRAKKLASAPKAKSSAKKSPVNGLASGSRVQRTLMSATLVAAKQLSSGASVPSNSPPAVFAALNSVAAAHNVDPAAIAGIIYVESVWDTTCVEGRYIGLTQVGPDFVQSLNLTQAQFLALSAADQITDYGKWLDFYKFNAQMAQYKIVPASLSLGAQAALLQGMQFSPNGSSWKIALAAGNTSVPTTNTKQANVLGDTSIGDMANYYSGFFGEHPPVYA